MLGLSDPEDFAVEGSSSTSSSDGSGHRMPAEHIWKASTTKWGARSVCNDEDCVIDDLESNIKTAVSRGRIVVLEPGPHSDHCLAKSLQAEEDGRTPENDGTQGHADLKTLMQDQMLDVLGISKEAAVGLDYFDFNLQEYTPSPNKEELEEDVPFLKLASDSEAEDSTAFEKEYFADRGDKTDDPYCFQMQRWLAPRWTRKWTCALLMLFVVILTAMRIEATWSWWEWDLHHQIGAIIAICFACVWFCISN